MKTINSLSIALAVLLVNTFFLNGQTIQQNWATTNVNPGTLPEQIAWIATNGNDSTAIIGNKWFPFGTLTNAVGSGAPFVEFEAGNYSISNGVPLEPNQTVYVPNGVTITNYCVIGVWFGPTNTDLLPLFGLTNNDTVIIDGFITDGYMTNNNVQVTAVGFLRNAGATNFVIRGNGRILGYSECVSLEGNYPSSGVVQGLHLLASHSTLNIIGAHTVVLDGDYIDTSQSPTNGYSTAHWSDCLFYYDSVSGSNNITINNCVIGDITLPSTIVPVRAPQNGNPNSVALNNTILLNNGSGYLFAFADIGWPVYAPEPPQDYIYVNGSIPMSAFDLRGEPGAIDTGTPPPVFTFNNYGTYLPNNNALPQTNNIHEQTGTSTNYWLQTVRGNLYVFWTDTNADTLYSNQIAPAILPTSINGVLGSPGVVPASTNAVLLSNVSLDANATSTSMQLTLVTTAAIGLANTNYLTVTNSVPLPFFYHWALSPCSTTTASAGQWTDFAISNQVNGFTLWSLGTAPASGKTFVYNVTATR